MSDVDLDSLFKQHLPEQTEEVWRTKDGREIPLSKMDDRHLLNTIRFIAARHSTVALVGVDSVDLLPDKYAESFRKQTLYKLKQQLTMLIKEAKRRKVHEWLKFGLSGTALEIINDAGD